MQNTPQYGHGAAVLVTSAHGYNEGIGVDQESSLGLTICGGLNSGLLTRSNSAKHNTAVQFPLFSSVPPTHTNTAE